MSNMMDALLGGGGGSAPGMMGGGGGAPPTHIPLPGAGPDAGGGQGVPGPDSPKVADLVSQAADLLQQAAGLESDAPDKAFLSDIVAKAHKFLGDQQKLQDTAMGAGPGAKMVRKATGPGY